MKGIIFVMFAVLIVLSAAGACATTIFQDDFNSYADDAALLSVWSRVSGTSTAIGLTPDPANPSNQTIRQTQSAGQLRHTIIGGIAPTIAEPIISFSFDLYDPDGGTASGRVVGQIRNSASASGMLAAGIYNSTNIGTYDTTRYQARTVDGGGWVQLTALRSIGWHTFRFDITGTTANLYVDNVLDPDFTGRAAGSVMYDWVAVGSGLSTNTQGYFDNVNVVLRSQSAVPIPGALLLFAPGLIGLGVLRKRFKK